MVLSGNTQLKLITLNQLSSRYEGLRFLNSISKMWILEWVWPQNVFTMWQMKLTGHFNNKLNSWTYQECYVDDITPTKINTLNCDSNSCQQMLQTYWSLELLFQGCSNLLYSGSRTDPDGTLGLELLCTAWQKSYFQKEFFTCYFCYNWHKIFLYYVSYFLYKIISCKIVLPISYWTLVLNIYFGH